jgi:hypothetical protein
MTANLPATAAKLPPMTDCDVSSMPHHELTDHRKRVGAIITAMMKVGAYFEADSAEVLDQAVLRDWIDRLQDWSPEAIRKAFWVWQDQQPNRRPGPAHILHILRDAHGRQVAKAVASLPKPEDPPRQRVSPEAAARIAAAAGGLPARIFKTLDGITPTE